MFIKTSKTLPELEERSKLPLSDLYIKYIPKVICPYCKCLKMTRKTHHCAICQVCVKEFDHHCFWINSCVGKGNLGYFLITLSLLMLDSSYSATISLIIYEIVESEVSKIFAFWLCFISAIMLLCVSPYFYLNFTNYLNSITVRQGFSVKKKDICEDLDFRNSMLAVDDPLANIDETKRESDYSDISQLSGLQKVD